LSIIILLLAVVGSSTDSGRWYFLPSVILRVSWKAESSIYYKEYVLNVNEVCLDMVSFSPQMANENFFLYKYLIAYIGSVL